MAITGYALLSIIVFSLFTSSIRSEQTQTKEFVLTLDHTNFTETINKQVLIVVNVYTSWCKDCKELAHEFEKVASKLSSNLVFAKIDATEETNRELTNKYEIKSFPTILVVGYVDGGKLVEYYYGPKELLTSYLNGLIKEHIHSLEIKSAIDAAEIVGDNRIIVVGVFPKLSGSEFDSFLATAEKLRPKYDFAHTLDAKLLPRGEFVTGPVVRLFKPFDELFVDSKDFNGEALEKFIKKSSIPLITIFDKDPDNKPYVIKFFDSVSTNKVMLFIKFSGEGAQSLKSKYREVVTSNKGQGLSFLVGDVGDTQSAFQFFGLEESQIPLIFIQTAEDKRYMKENVEVDQIDSWVKDFKDGKLAPHDTTEKQNGHASVELKSFADAEVICDNKIFVVGFFPKLFGAEFDSFLATAKNLRSEFDFLHTKNPKLFPGNQPFATSGPVVRLLKPFDEHFADSNDFDGEALEKFIEESSLPLIAVFDKRDMFNLPYVMLFMNFAGEAGKSLNLEYIEVAKSNKGQGLSFLKGNAENTQEVLEIYGLEESQVPLILVNTADKIRYLKTNVEVGQIESWLNDFKDGKLSPYTMSQPIPAVNNEPVKVVVYNSLDVDDMVFNSGKNVLLEIYDPMSGLCQKLVPILNKVAVSYQSDPSVVIATIDVITNDVPNVFPLTGFPTIYFRSASGNIVLYEGDMTKEDIISFIDKNKDIAEEPKKEGKTTDGGNDEL